MNPEFVSFRRLPNVFRRILWPGCCVFGKQSSPTFVYFPNVFRRNPVAAVSSSLPVNSSVSLRVFDEIRAGQPFSGFFGISSINVVLLDEIPSPESTTQISRFRYVFISEFINSNAELYSTALFAFVYNTNAF